MVDYCILAFPLFASPVSGSDTFVYTFVPYVLLSLLLLSNCLDLVIIIVNIMTFV